MRTDSATRPNVIVRRRPRRIVVLDDIAWSNDLLALVNPERYPCENPF